MELYVGVDVHFYMFPLPKGINSLFMEHKDNYYIAINSNVSLEKQKKALRHEIQHLVAGDMDSEELVSMLERMNHQ